MFKYTCCVDSNSEFCPCELAEEGECLACSLLSGSSFCECTSYSGLCIYQEFAWNGKKAGNAREYIECQINSTEWLRDDVVLLKINVTEKMAQELSRIGAFVFLKKPGSKDNHAAPISIIESDKTSNLITVAIKITGLKTKALSKAGNSVMVKGPFWNGIQGQRFLSNQNGSCMIIGRGIGLAPAIMAAEKMRERGWNIFSMLEKGRGDKNYFEHFFTALGCKAESLCLIDQNGQLAQNNMEAICKCIENNNIKTVLSAGNDLFHEMIIHALHAKYQELRFATVNNSTMCCGEGSCGSCIMSVGNRKKIKACKVQYNPLEYFLEGQESE